jgi:hypothetical protein
MVTLNFVELSLLNACTTTEVGKTLGDHPAVSEDVKV